MPIDVVLIMTFVAYSSFGAGARTVFGIYRAYSSYMNFKLSWQRVAIEILASMFFGIFGAMLLNELGVWKIGINIAAILAGFFGADVITLLTKKFGLSKGIEVRVVEQVEYPDLNLKQQKAMEYLKKNGRITNSIYQKMNQVTRSSAMWDLRVLSDKNLVKKNGSGRGAYYILTKDALKSSSLKSSSLKSGLRNAH